MNKQEEKYRKIIGEIGHEAVWNVKYLDLLKESYGKLGLYASAADFVQDIYYVRKMAEDDGTQREGIRKLGLDALCALHLYSGEPVGKIIEKQIDLYSLKNKRYGNSFSECYALDGLPYALGHLQEKINRICSLLMLNDTAKDEPIVDSYKDLLGYCVLTLCEITQEEVKDDEVQDTQN